MNKVTLKYNVKYYDYLDALRETGAINMFGASVYIEKEFNVDHKLAISILSDWMQTFSKRR